MHGVYAEMGWRDSRFVMHPLNDIMPDSEAFAPSIAGMTSFRLHQQRTTQKKKHAADAPPVDPHLRHAEPAEVVQHSGGK